MARSARRSATPRSPRSTCADQLPASESRVFGAQLSPWQTTCWSIDGTSARSVSTRSVRSGWPDDGHQTGSMRPSLTWPRSSASRSCADHENGQVAALADKQRYERERPRPRQPGRFAIKIDTNRSRRPLHEFSIVVRPDVIGEGAEPVTPDESRWPVAGQRRQSERRRRILASQHDSRTTTGVVSARSAPTTRFGPCRVRATASLMSAADDPICTSMRPGSTMHSPDRP